MRDPQTGVHWHLARLWLGAGGGGPLCAKGKPKRKLPAKDAGYKALLDSKRGHGPEVAGALTFVGRRREAQAVLAAFRADKAPGRAAARHGQPRQVEPGGAGGEPAAGRSRRWWSTGTTTRWRCWSRSEPRLPPGDPRGHAEAMARGAIAQRPEALAEALEALLEGPFFDHPILLVVDDLEQVLEDPAPGQTLTPVRTENRWRVAIAAVLAAFGRAARATRG